MAPLILITGATGLIGFRTLVMALEAGYRVRFTARSEAKARTVSSNTAVLKLSPGERLSPVIIPDSTVDAAFDAAMEGVTHVIHAGAPVARSEFDPTTEIFEPTLKMAANVLYAAHKTPTVRRVVITSSIVGILGFDVPTDPVPSAAMRANLPDPARSKFDDVFEAYISAKVLQLRETEDFVRTREPAFTVSHIVPGYVFGRNELVLDTEMIQEHNSSNAFLMMAILGGALPFPIHGAFAHLDDVAELHLRVAFLDPLSDAQPPRDFGIGTKITHDEAFEHVKEAFPEAVAQGIFKQGSVPTIPMEFDSTETVQLLGRNVRSFREGVVDAAGQYLELLGKSIS